MLVWGGGGDFVSLNSGGRYALGHSSDDDDDGFTECDGDCDDGNDQIWATPGEALDLVFSADKQTLIWSATVNPGSTSVVYDTLRSGDPADFTTDSGAECLESDDGADTQATDFGIPVTGSVRHYLVRAQNDCPAGLGTLGTDHLGAERAGRACP